MLSTNRQSGWKVILEIKNMGKFNDIRGSSAYDAVWKVLPVKITVNKDPIFKQIMLSRTLEQLIEISFPQKSASDKEPAPTITLSANDEKIIRYIAGYVPVSLRKKLEKSSNPHKEEFILCLWSMCEDDSTCDDFLSYSHKDMD